MSFVVLEVRIVRYQKTGLKQSHIFKNKIKEPIYTFMVFASINRDDDVPKLN